MSEKKEKSIAVQEVSFDFRPEIKYNPRCLCDNTGCARHGNCRACAEFHRLTAHPATCQYAWCWKKGCEATKTEKRYSDKGR